MSRSLTVQVSEVDFFQTFRILNLLPLVIMKPFCVTPSDQIVFKGTAVVTLLKM